MTVHYTVREGKRVISVPMTSSLYTAEQVEKAFRDHAGDRPSVHSAACVIGGVAGACAAFAVTAWALSVWEDAAPVRQATTIVYRP